VAGQGRGKPSAIGAGAFHPDPDNRAVTGKPAVEPPIALGAGAEARITQQCAEMADRRDGMGIA
jgi:hypothetical protein